ARGLGVPSAFYHFAFEAGSEAALDEKRHELIAKGIEVTDVVDHDWAKSIYFKDPNGIQLEFCCFTRNLNTNDARMQDRFEMSVKRLGLDDPTEARTGLKHLGAGTAVEAGAPARRSVRRSRARRARPLPSAREAGQRPYDRLTLHGERNPDVAGHAEARARHGQHPFLGEQAYERHVVRDRRLGEHVERALRLHAWVPDTAEPVVHQVALFAIG